MKKNISILLIVMVITLILPVAPALAYKGTSMGTIESGQKYSGVTPKNSGGNPIPVRFELPVTENSMIRLFVYTQSKDTTVYIENEDAPYNSDDSKGSFRGSCLTSVNDFYQAAPNTFNTSSFSCRADSRNSNSYTELYGNLAAGNYHVVVDGDTYEFMIVLEPLLYQGTTSFNNSSKENAQTYTIGNEQQGILITNGAVNKSYYSDEQTSTAWYKFNADKGKYKLSLYTDGFFQGNAKILNASGSSFEGAYEEAVANLTFSSGDQIAATYEEHSDFSGSEFTTDFNIKDNGTYYININRKAWTAGSYQFVITPYINEDNEEENTDTSEESELIVSSVQISPSIATIKAGAFSALSAMVTYSDSSVEDMTEFVTWSSSNNKVATVDDQGKVKGLSAGTATITAMIENKKSTCTVTVTQNTKITKLIPSKSTIYLKTGKTATNKITAYYSDGSKKAVTTVATYHASSTGIQISKQGILKATRKGTYKITVTFGGKKITYKVVVK